MVTTVERCPLPGCENPAGTGKTGACCLAHAGTIAWAARKRSPAGRARTPAVVTEPKPTTKQQRLVDEQRLRERHHRIDQALREREARVFAAHRASGLQGLRR
jgi:hypothetical protein